MDSLSLLRESLPNAKLESAERDMSLDFKAAAQSLASFYKSSRQTVKHAHDAGYAACLQDMLQFIQTGLSTAAAEDDAMGVARVMDWVEGQLERFRAGKEFEGRGESADEASTSTSAAARRSFSPPRRPAQEVGPEHRSPSHTPRRTESSSALVDPAPIPAPPFTIDPAPSAKRRHAAITSVDPAPSRRRSRVFSAPVPPAPLDTRPARRAKRGGGVVDRDRGVVIDSRGSDLMDFEEEGPRDRKRSRTARADSTSSAN